MKFSRAELRERAPTRSTAAVDRDYRSLCAVPGREITLKNGRVEQDNFDA